MSELRAAYLLGSLAARTGRPITDQPYDLVSDRLRVVWFVRGYRSHQEGNTDGSAE